MKLLIKYISLFIVLFIYSQITVNSKSLDLNQPIPFDSTIRKAVLPNGLTYFIKKNQRPEKRLELRLVINAGSVLEDSDQLGLAHFTEHMAFNGTKNFPKNQLVSYLQSMGIKFGPEINAYTGFDETVYMLQLPTDKPDLVETSIKILEDWAHHLLFDSIEIEKERGVIIEEWRLGRGADQRLQDKYLPLIFYQSQYAQRLPIGNKEILETFSHNSLKRFYNQWYRPDLMAVIAVGDMNVDSVENLIIKYFSNIPKRDSIRKRVIYDVPFHAQTLYGVFFDKEAYATMIGIYNKIPFLHETTIGEYRNSILRLLYFQMLNQRISELIKKPNTPFINAFSNFGNIGARKTYAYYSVAICEENKIADALTALLVENLRVKKYGFTPSELERAKLEILKMYEQYYNEREKTESNNFADELTRHFLTNEPVPGIATEYTIVKESLPNIFVDEINQLANQWITDQNRVVIVTAPEKEGIHLPDTSELRKIVEASENIHIEPYNDNIPQQNLIESKIKKGKIIQEKVFSLLQIHELTLKNGVKVYLKPTDFKNDEIILSAISKGGYLLSSENDHFSAKYAVALVLESGVGKYNAIELKKALAGKNVSVTPYISEYTEGIKASSTPQDVETMLQLIYLYFNQPRIDSLAVQSWMLRQKAYLANVLVDPKVYYSDQLMKILSQNHPRAKRIPTPNDIDKIIPNRALEFYKNRFTNAADFKFVMVGNFNIDSIKPLIEKYLGSLPSNQNFENWNDLNIRPPKTLKQNIYKGTDPKSLTTLFFSDTISYNRNDAYFIRSLEDYLDIRLIEVLREEMSGVYGVGASCSFERVPYEHYKVIFRIPCSPINVDSLVNETLLIIDDIKNNGIADDYLLKIKETQFRELEVNLKRNKFWQNYIENSIFYGDDIERILYKFEEINRLTSKNIQQIAQRIIGKNFVWVTLYPEPSAK